MQRIRVLIATRPRLMRELISTMIADQPDTRPDVLIVPMDDRDKYRVQCGFLLGRYPEMKILALAPEQNRALFYWAIVDIRSRPLESSETGILDAMRQRSQVVGLARI
jgi:hypothetical protein